MTGHFDSFDEMRTLLDALVEERITPEEMKRLEAFVLQHPEAEAFYVQYMSMVADLAGQLDRLPARAEESLRARVELATPALTPVKGPRRFRRIGWSVAAAVVLVAVVLVAVNLLNGPSGNIPPHKQDAAEALDNTVAVLVQAPGAQWEETGMPTRPGAPLPPGVLRLKSGLAHLEFYCGAMVILEGPAEFKLISRTEAYCARGKLRAHVPQQAQGFAIGTPKMYLVDRGTEFGLRVGGKDKTEVHVFKGQVDLYDSAAMRDKAHSVFDGQARSLDAPGKYRPIDLNAAGFSTDQDVAKESQAEAKRRQKDWLIATDVLRKDKDVLVYFPFQTPSTLSRTLLDQARGREDPRDGAIVGCSWATGRWPGRRGLEFKRVGDRVRFSVKGEYDSLTLMSWVRFDALPNRNNSLMMSEGWPEGSLHWQVGDSGTIILGVQSSPKGKGAHYHAVQMMTPERFGQWLHLAVVYDKDKGVVTHYMDGRPLAQSDILFDIPLRIGDAELGNWNIATHRNNTPVRNLCGSMDEFMMFSRALNDEEIDRYFHQGRPPL